MPTVEFTEKKPLGHKSYGSIGHLQGSRVGPADHHVSDGQARIATEKLRDRHDRVILQEKLDGSSVSIARLYDGNLVALQRKGWLASQSPYEMLQRFADWVDIHAIQFEAIEKGQRLCGEWLALAHGTRYNLYNKSPFVAFDLMVKMERLGHDATRLAARLCDIPMVPTLSDGPPVSIAAGEALLGKHGRYGAIDPAEGLVWRVERKGRVDFLCKYVRPDKVDGLYIRNDHPPIWHYP